MAKIIKRNKALSVSPLKTNQAMGASLAFLGINRAIPMLHGSQGCAAFAKVFFVRHFREPIPLQTTAMDQVSTVMGAEDNIIEGLKTLCEKAEPALIGVPTTGLSETQGIDMKPVVKVFRQRYPQFSSVKVVPVSTPDFSGCLESGFAAAVRALIEELVPQAEEAGTQPGRQQRQVNVLASSHLTPGDVEVLKGIIEGFGLRPVLIPDLSDSLDGRLTELEFSPITVGGTPVSEFATLGDAAASLVIGPSLAKAADILRQRTGVPEHRFDHLMGLEAVDELLMTLAAISGNPVPECLQRQRAQLQDAMLDTHFMLGQARFAIAADPDLLNAFGQFLNGMGAEVVAVVASSRAPVLERIPARDVTIGDLEDLEYIAKDRNAELLIGNSHAAVLAERLGLPLLRAGFPQYDRLGGYQRNWIGYRGIRQALFDLADILLASNRHEIKPYRSIYAQKRQEVFSDGIAAVSENG
ncbi:nitrogenase molybdenum-iron protein beta chain [bacterium BMS3Abin11]|nr:nitrogenase molybdenum-iron protein beta chain [bacterium BMS3Abin11]GMT40475.1 MAG: nitrogenase molybdenum-cofactor biosynthesis protein NifN [bacterium]HDZ78529.1 nitrogenase iron-molybdenum cofactor biosynthesis protein NifN [Gammaproteobacteria bacterium]